ncbi:auxin-responsive protein SAUR15-like [Apium graveolens]|uniref:auxin-responsive protein SAUR15-like n=1 Tax=Apium graveolens TaxID=4045 RepID=UPI003D7B2415
MGRGFAVLRKLLMCGKKSLIFPSEVQSSVPEGRIRVVVGKAKSDEEVVEIEAHYLNHPLLERLLSLTREEYGYSYQGALRIACNIHLFRYLLHQLDGRNPSAHYMDLPHLILNFSKSSYGSH